MNIYSIMSESPYLSALVIVLCIGSAFGFVSRVFIVLPNRILRHRNIRLHGYPPPHCDADGDFKEKPDE